jgi:hypothetical protein
VLVYWLSFNRQQSVATVARLEAELKAGRDRQVALERQITSALQAEATAGTSDEKKRTGAPSAAGGTGRRSVEAKVEVSLVEQPLTSSQQARVESIFKLIDADGSGHIDKVLFTLYLSNLIIDF